MSEHADFLETIASDSSRWAGIDPQKIRDAAALLRRLEKVVAAACHLAKYATYLPHTNDLCLVSANAMADLQAALATPTEQS